MPERKIATLGDHIEVLPGFPFKSGQYTERGLRLLRGDNIGQGRLRWDGVKYWPEELSHGVGVYEVAAGDVVLAMDRPWIEAGLKYAAVTPEDTPCLLVQRVARLRARGSLDQGFLRYLIASKQFVDHVLSVQTGSAVPHISVRQIREFSFPLPPLSEQQAIGEVLGALDDKIDANARLSALSESIAIANLERTADRAAVSTFAHVCREQARPLQFANEVVDHYSLPAFDERRLPDRCSGAKIKSNKFRLASPAVLVSKLNPHIPRVWFAVPTDGVLGLASTEFVVLQPHAGWVPAVLWAACATRSFQAGLADLVTGTTGSHQRVRPQDVLDAPVVDLSAVSPEMREMTEALVKRAHGARRESIALAALRDTLLPPLISGDLRVCDAEAVVSSTT